MLKLILAPMVVIILFEICADFFSGKKSENEVKLLFSGQKKQANQKDSNGQRE